MTAMTHENIFFSALVNTLIAEGKGHTAFAISFANLHGTYKEFYEPFIGVNAATGQRMFLSQRSSVAVTPYEARVDELMAQNPPRLPRLLNHTTFGRRGVSPLRAAMAVGMSHGYKIYTFVPECLKELMQGKVLAYDPMVRLSKAPVLTPPRAV